MAISPNTNFTAGQILTATQQNQFPRGIMAIGNQTSTQNGITTETQIVASSSFTAVAGRYYRITFYAPQLFKTTSSFLAFRIRKTNTAGTQYQANYVNVPASTLANGMVVVVTTLDAGSQVIIGSIASDSGSVASEPSATNPAQIIVEDIGLA